MINGLDYKGIKVAVSKKITTKLKDKITFSLMYSVSDQKFENCMDFLLITHENKSHFVYIKNFQRLMCNKTKNKNKKHF